MSERISRLLRTNIALIFLCFISIGVFFSLRGQNFFKENFSDTADSSVSSGISSKINDSLAKSPLKHMPSPDVFEHFTYIAGQIVKIEGNCNDKYRVVLIFPADIDYRIDTMAAKYNRATECIPEEKYTEVIDDSIRLFKPDDSYYIVRASEGDSGLWHDPY